MITVCGPSLTYWAVHPFSRAVGPSARTRSRATVQGESEEEDDEGGGGGGGEAAAPVAAAALPPPPPPLAPAPARAAEAAECTIILVLTTSMGAVHVVVTRPVAADAARCVAVPSPAPVSLLHALLAES